MIKKLGVAVVLIIISGVAFYVFYEKPISSQDLFGTWDIVAVNQVPTSIGYITIREAKEEGAFGNCDGKIGNNSYGWECAIDESSQTITIKAVLQSFVRTAQGEDEFASFIRQGPLSFSGSLLDTMRLKSSSGTIYTLKKQDSR